MSRTYRTPESKARNYYNREEKSARKTTTRAFRRANRDLARDFRTGAADFDATALPRHRGTEGRLTW